MCPLLYCVYMMIYFSTLPPSAYSVLDIQWKAALHSAYNSLLSEQSNCGYFYILCEGFTIFYKRYAVFTVSLWYVYNLWLSYSDYCDRL